MGTCRQNGVRVQPAPAQRSHVLGMWTKWGRQKEITRKKKIVIIIKNIYIHIYFNIYVYIYIFFPPLIDCECFLFLFFKIYCISSSAVV